MQICKIERTGGKILNNSSIIQLSLIDEITKEMRDISRISFFQISGNASTLILSLLFFNGHNN